MSLRERNRRHGHGDRIWRRGYRDRICCCSMADVEGAVACVFTGIRRGGLRCSILVLRDVWEAKYRQQTPCGGHQL